LRQPQNHIIYCEEKTIGNLKLKTDPINKILFNI
jgi:hypothetical protein